MPKDYDVEEAFRAIENELINSMMKNLSHHRAEETKEGYNWTSWQAEQLKALNIYKQKNSKKFNKQFRDINDKINKSILLHRKTGATDQEKEILEAIKKGAKLTHKAESTIEGAFFRINDRKLDALLNEINGSMRRAETAMLRMANDQYRKAIFNAQVYFNTGAGTYEKAVDMATKDYLGRGINCVQYKNGARVNIASYAGMALRTANTRAYLQGEGAKRQEWGISTVVVHKRGLPCPKCANWTGKILIDDVWSGGKASDGPYPLMSQAIAGGLYHPNCKDGHSTYFPGISDKPEKITKKEMKQAVIAEKQENRNKLIQRNVDKFDRLSNYSLDEENKKKYATRTNQWNNIKEFSNGINIEKVTESGKFNSKRVGNNNVDLIKMKKEFGKKFNQLTNDSATNNSLRKYAKAMLTHRNGTDGEDLYIISKKAGKKLFSKTNSNNILGVELNKEEIELIRQMPSKIGIHNHPTNILPTGSDFVVAGYRKYDFGLVITHDLKVFKYKVGNRPFPATYLDNKVDKYMGKNYNLPILEAQEKALQELSKEGLIEWKEILA
ncbi:phage minor capsid protein [Eubacterium sp.]|uniref:phage minor capsid protein n=1 Tax=Eubacterium sp. TaxID=142586 RepID=UPI00351FF5E7